MIDSEKLIYEIEKLGNELMLMQKGSYVCVKKDMHDVATNADLFSEQRIADIIKKLDPKSQIYSEESNILPGTKSYFIVDPLDGSKNYIRQMPEYCISIAHNTNGLTTFGLIHIPATHVTYFAHKGGGAYVQAEGRTLRLRFKPTPISESFLHVEAPTPESKKQSPKLYQEKVEQYNKLLQASYRVRSIGSGAIALAYTAHNMFDGYVDLSGTTKTFDLAAGILICNEAGAKSAITDLGLYVGISPEF